jgi:precorrin-6A/cobalt-precorrin-6A reductase
VTYIKKLLILGGTGDAVQLSQQAAILGFAVISSLAGRTQQSWNTTHSGADQRVRMGGFGGAAGLADYLRQENIELLIDATHPFAQQISGNAAAAAALCGVPRLLLQRPSWEPVTGDHWLLAPHQAAAAALLPGLGQRIFLTIGRQELSNYAHLQELWFLMRSIDPPPAPLPPGKIILAQGPFNLQAEKDLLRQHQIEIVVSKNSGGAATYAKITAARELGLPIVMIQRPSRPDGLEVSSVAAAISWLKKQR